MDWTGDKNTCSVWAATIAAVAGLCLAGCGGSPDAAPENPAPAAVVTGSEPARSAPVQAAPAEISKAHPFVNSLGMKFVPLPNSRIQMSVWETRVQDFAAYLRGTGQPVPGFPSAKNLHPAAGVSWNDASAFCVWLTDKEQKEGHIGPKDRYRLPKDKEWTVAVGETRYPWGNDWPKTEERVELPGYKPASGDHTAPVGSFPANELGLHDLGGNVFEWCLDWYSMDLNPSELRLEFERLSFDGKGTTYKVLRGASWVFFDSLNLVSGYRYFNLPESRGVLYGFRTVLERDALGQGQPAPKHLPPWTLPDADARSIAGREAYRGNCVECHQYYDPVLYPDGDWASWLQKMKGKAKLGDAPYRDLVHFVEQMRRKG